MLSKTDEKLILSLRTKKGRDQHGLCLVEGSNVIAAAGTAIAFTFTRQDTDRFDDLVTTETPQDVAAVARIPAWRLHDVWGKGTVVVLDGVQDPGNVGAVIRLCQGFDASLLLVESADPVAPKVVRSSAGGIFSVPWVRVARADAPDIIASLRKPVYRLELREGSAALDASPFVTQSTEQALIIAGSEGNGIALDVKGSGISIQHDPALESLNVGNALAIVLHARYQERKKRG
jgi:RNA methyltransferase, TrmH family